MKNIDKYKSELKGLINLGEKLHISIQYECFPKELSEQIKEKLDPEKYKEAIKNISPFSEKYQHWYSESLAVVKQILPDRLADFVKLYERPKNRKQVDYENYVIEDYLQGLIMTRGSGYDQKVTVNTSAAIPKFRTQLNILKSVEKRFESTLFDIRQLVQADILDSEIEEAKELCKNKFYRAAGAICGVVIEKHLAQVCQNHNLPFTKKNLTINDFNEALKNNNVIDTPTWRSIQYFADIRNLCDHDKKQEPTEAQVTDLINGVDKLIKTLF